jgi:hypothetical protein
MTPLNIAKSVASSQLVFDTWLELELTNSNHALLTTYGGAMNAGYQPIFRELFWVSLAESLAWAFRRFSEPSRHSDECPAG